MRVAIVNSSPNVYNLAVHRIANYHIQRGDTVNIVEGYGLLLPDIWNADKCYFSCIFTWDLPNLVNPVRLLLKRGIEVEIGGPAATAMSQYIVEQTGITPYTGLDPRFEYVDGKFKTAFTSRGCPRNCSFCIVTRLEGKKLIEYDDFPIPTGDNPWICDNNILMTSWPHQEMVVEKVKHLRNLDFNSGFDDRVWIKDPEKYWNLYHQLHLTCWRFAYDSPEQRQVIKDMAEFMHSKGVSYRSILVYCIIGIPGDTFEAARERLQYLIDIGVSPYPQRFRPLNLLEHQYTPPGWEPRQLELLFGYFGVAFIWRSCSFKDYLRSKH